MSNLSFEQMLFFSPYSKDTSYKDTIINGEEFFKSFRIIPEEPYKKAKDNLKNLIGSSGSTKRFFILSGYSGNGKTTFLYWFREEIEKENYYFEIINLIEQGIGVVNKDPLMRACVIAKLVEDFKNKEVINFICDNQESFLPLFGEKEMRHFFRAKSDDNFNISRAFDFFTNKEYVDKEDGFKRILILFLLQRIFKFINTPDLKSKETYTFCFDNLDELELEYLTPTMWRTVSEVSELMPEIIKKTKLPFEFSRKVKFVLVFREANFATSASAQWQESIDVATLKQRFILMPYIGKNIIEKRIEECEKRGILEDKDKPLKDALEIIIKEKITEYIILPLFNYDYRWFIRATQNIIKNNFIDLTEYDQIPTNNEFKYGKRGIIVNAYIKYMANEKYLEKLAPIRDLKEGCYCNPIRLILTVFSNLSPNWESDKEIQEAKPNQFSLLEAFDACKGIFSASKFLKKVTDLINIEQSSWTHLITIYGKNPKKHGIHTSFNFDEEIPKLEYYQKHKSHYDELLNEISFSLNASAYIYLRHLLTHFEYISAYKLKGANIGRFRGANVEWRDMKPLFQLTKIVPKEAKWEFQYNIDEVFKHVKTYCSNIEEYYNATFFKTGLFKNKEDFIKSDFVFKKENNKKECGENKGHLYMGRLITSHIEYIEIFRHYITSNGYTKIEAELKKNEEINAKIKIKTKEDIHTYLLDIIEKYLQCLEGIDDPTQYNVLMTLKQRLKGAREDNTVWIAVNAERNVRQYP